MLPKMAIVTNISDGLGYSVNDRNYIGLAYNRVIEIVDKFENGMLLTNFYMPAFKDLLNDYSYHGFLIVSVGNIEYV
jgi:hypothetical protein